MSKTTTVISKSAQSMEEVIDSIRKDPKIMKRIESPKTQKVFISSQRISFGNQVIAIKKSGTVTQIPLRDWLYLIVSKNVIPYRNNRGLTATNKALVKKIINNFHHTSLQSFPINWVSERVAFVLPDSHHRQLALLTMLLEGKLSHNDLSKHVQVSIGKKDDLIGQYTRLNIQKPHLSGEKCSNPDLVNGSQILRVLNEVPHEVLGWVESNKYPEIFFYKILKNHVYALLHSEKGTDWVQNSTYVEIGSLETQARNSLTQEKSKDKILTKDQIKLIVDSIVYVYEILTHPEFNVTHVKTANKIRRSQSLWPFLIHNFFNPKQVSQMNTGAKNLQKNLRYIAGGLTRNSNEIAEILGSRLSGGLYELREKRITKLAKYLRKH